jgi:hypothetical protein
MVIFFMVTKIDETQAPPMGFGQRWIRFDGSVLNGFDDDPRDCGCNSTARQATVTHCRDMGDDSLWLMRFKSR